MNGVWHCVHPTASAARTTRAEHRSEYTCCNLVLLLATPHRSPVWVAVFLPSDCIRSTSPCALIRLVQGCLEQVYLSYHSVVAMTPTLYRPVMTQELNSNGIETELGGIEWERG